MKVLRGILPIAFLLLAACGSNDDHDPEAMTQDQGDGRYHNAKFGLTIEKPDSWYSQDIEEMMMAMQLGGDLMSGDDKNLQAVFDSAMKTSLPLFGFYEYSPGTPGKLNANVVAVAENIAMYPGVASGCDYLQNAKMLMEQSRMQMTVENMCSSRTVNGTDLAYFDVAVNYGPQTVQQRYFACRKGEHAISIIQSYFDDESEAKVDALVNTLELDC